VLLLIDPLQADGFEFDEGCRDLGKGSIAVPPELSFRSSQILFGYGPIGEFLNPANASCPTALPFVHGIGVCCGNEQHAHLRPAARTGDRDQVDAEVGIGCLGRILDHRVGAAAFDSPCIALPTVKSTYGQEIDQRDEFSMSSMRRQILAARRDVIFSHCLPA
jgi:hypothetical protein